MPNLAFQLDIPRERRRYLGGWAREETADEYIREKRNVVCGIWKEVVSQLDPSKLKEDTQVPLYLNHTAYELFPPSPSAPASVEPSSPALKKAKSRGADASGSDTSSLDESLPASSDQAGTFVQADRTSLYTKDKLPADQVPTHKGGPLTPIANLAKTAVKVKGVIYRKYKIHLLRIDRKCVGCGWEPEFFQYQDVTEDDFDNEHVLCSKCFLLYTWPGSLPTPPLQPGASADEASDIEDTEDDSDVDLPPVPWSPE